MVAERFRSYLWNHPFIMSSWPLKSIVSSLSSTDSKTDPNQTSFFFIFYIPIKLDGSNQTSLITKNANVQLPIKLTLNNFPYWKAPLNSLFLGHNCSSTSYSTWWFFHPYNEPCIWKLVPTGPINFTWNNRVCFKECGSIYYVLHFFYWCTEKKMEKMYAKMVSRYFNC